MKKLILVFLALIGTMTGYSQSQRLVLLEEFTSATCGPCVSKNTTFHNWQTQNPDKFTSIYYHVNWPSAGDPMNLANPADASTRVNYYMPSGNHYVPYSVLDGNYYNGSAAGWTMTTVNNRYAVPSPFEVSVKHQISVGQDSVFSYMLIKCTQNVSASMTAHNVIIEKYIHFNAAPCANSNGERDFYNVMKKMLPTSSGTTLPTTMAPGDYVLLEGIWKFGTVYDVTQIAAVGFVQDKTTKEIYQTANSSTDALVMPYNTDLEVLNVSNVPAATCKSKIVPSVTVRNNGNDAITSMTIKYKVNDGTLNTYTWNGSITSMQKAVIALPEYSFSLLPQNTLMIYTTNPNNISDQYPKNDTLYFGMKSAPVTTNEISLFLRTDNAPQETTWDIKNSQGTVIASGGPYTQSSQVIQQTITLTQFDCFTFNIYDTGGNGLCCVNGSGAYQISSGSTVIKLGGPFGYSESSEFSYPDPSATTELNFTNALNVSPNPFDGSAKVSFFMGKSGSVTLSLYSMVGQLVTTRSLGNLSSGQHETILDGHILNPGIYILQLNTGTNNYSRKVSVVR
jgi:hypothetical protein